MKLRNSSGARIAWEGKETPNVPLSYFFPQFLLLSTCGHSGSAALAAPSLIPVHPQPQWEKPEKALIVQPQLKPPRAVSAALVTKPEHQASCSEGKEVNPSQTQCPVVCHSFWWWQPVPAVHLWFVAAFPKGGVCISVFESKY